MYIFHIFEKNVKNSIGGGATKLPMLQNYQYFFLSFPIFIKRWLIQIKIPFTLVITHWKGV